MTSEAAVIEVPAETKADTPVETKDLDTTAPVTDDTGNTVQTASDETTQAAPDTHLAELETERKAAEEARLNDLAEKKAKDMARQAQSAERDRANKERIRNARTEAVTKASALASQLSEGLYNEAGERMVINTKAFTDIIEGLNLVVDQSVSAEHAERYRIAFEAGLGDATDDFWKDAATSADPDGNVPVPTLLDLYVERKALSSQAVKEMDVEALKKASSKFRLELTNLLKAEYDRGRKNPVPLGEPTGGDGNPGQGNAWRTKGEARALHVKDLITNAEMRRINADPSIPD